MSVFSASLEGSISLFIMEPSSDRWVTKILALPIFDQPFARAIHASPLGTLAFIAAMEVKTGPEFADRVLALSEALDVEVVNTFQGREVMLEQIWALASAVEKAYFESSAVQIGFGLCERKAPVATDPTAVLRKQAAIKGLLHRPTPPPKRMKVSEPSSSSTPLLDKERNAKWKWAARLEEIGKRAGNHARLFSDPEGDGVELSMGERLQLKQLVLVAGAHRTMAAHVQTYERLEKWFGAMDLALYPLGIERILKFCLFLNDRACGPTVLPSLRAAVKWICSRLAIDAPDFEDPRFLALQKEIITERAKTLREAVPFPTALVGELKFYVLDEDKPLPSRVFVWWVLCMIFASLRFDDAVHVKPAELCMKEEGLFGVAWQTKVERRRTGTRFIVPKIGFKESSWLEIGWDLFQDTLSADRDFWIPELNSLESFKPEPPSFARSLQWMKWIARRTSDQSPALDHDTKVEHAKVINLLTMHSCRVTLLDAAVHAGRSAEEIGLQANWKNPGPLVLKYTRNRSAIPAVMVKQLVKDLVQEQHPVQEDDHTMLFDSCDTELCSIEFYIKQPSKGSYYEYKFHCNSAQNQETTACNKFNLVDCSSVGSTLPDTTVFCKACSKARPEVISSFEEATPASATASS